MLWWKEKGKKEKGEERKKEEEKKRGGKGYCKRFDVFINFTLDTRHTKKIIWGFTGGSAAVGGGSPP